MQRRTYGDGGIDARGENSWRLRYRVNGQRFTQAFHGTMSEARKELRRLIRSGDVGEHVAPDKMTLAQWIDHWICRCAGQQAATGGRSRHCRALRGTASLSCRSGAGPSAVATTSISRD